MTVVQQALEVMEQAKQEIFSLRAQNADLLAALKSCMDGLRDGCHPTAQDARMKKACEVIASIEGKNTYNPDIHRSSLEAYPHILNTSAAPVPEVSDGN